MMHKSKFNYACRKTLKAKRNKKSHKLGQSFLLFNNADSWAQVTLEAQNLKSNCYWNFKSKGKNIFINYVIYLTLFA